MANNSHRYRFLSKPRKVTSPRDTRGEQSSFGIRGGEALSRAFSRDNESVSRDASEFALIVACTYVELATFPRKVAVNTLKCGSSPSPRHVANGNGRANGGIPGNPALSAIEKGTPRATSQLQNAPFFLLRGKTSSGPPIIEYPLPPSNMFPFSLLTSPRRRGASEKVGSFGARLSPIPSSALLIRPCFSFALAN